MRAVHPLRLMTPEEELALERILKTPSERVDVVKRAKAIIAVRAGQPYTQAARKAGYKSGDSVSHLVERFNQQGLAALLIAPGRGPKETYSSEQREHIIQEFKRTPDRRDDATTTWSLMTLRNALRKEALPHIGVSTVREVLHEAGYCFGETRTWCHTETDLRVRKSGTTTVQDLKTKGK